MTMPRNIRLIAAIAALLFIAAACSTTQEEAFVSNLAAAEDGADNGGPDPVPDPECDEANPQRSFPALDPLPDPNSLPANSYMAEIRENGTLRAGVAADTLLFGFLNPQTGNIEGFDIEIAKLVAEAIFGSSEGRLELIPITSAERIPRLQEGSVDIVVKTMTITCQRWGQINFSSVYYEAGQRLLVRSDADVDAIEDIVDERICSASGTTSLANLETRGVPTVEQTGWTECLVAFQRGLADGISTDDTILAGLAAQDPHAKVVGPFFSMEPYGIGLPQDDQFTAFINAVLEEARTDGTWVQLHNEWLSDVLGPANAAPEAGPER